MSSTRARLLKEALQRYNELLQDDCNPRGIDDLVLYGIDGQEPTKHPDFSTEDATHFNRMIRSLYDELATAEATTRTTLVASDPFSSQTFVRHFERMTPVARKAVRDMLSHIAEFSQSGDRDQVLRDTRGDTEHIDRHYASEILDKLGRIVDRAARLDRIEVKANCPKDLLTYFKEAHECYLYGFPVASAILCRAIVESALKDKVTGQFKDLGDRIEEAHQRNLLSQDRRVMAYEVKGAGNDAVHQYDRFARGDLSCKAEECLLKTRAIVEELYRGTSDGGAR